MNEFDWIQLIQKKSVKTPKGWLGIGDDAAVYFNGSDQSNVIATDAIVEGVDFDSRVKPQDAGRKALAINLSDMAAMGARPTAFLMTLGVPSLWNGAKLRQFIDGVMSLAKDFKTPCIGGDMSSSKQFFCNIVILGQPLEPGVIRRSGACKGDILLVTGECGGSILQKHYSFKPRVEQGLWLADKFRPTAMMDISDGLAQDLNHLLRASKVGANLHLERVPVSAAAKSLHAKRADQIHSALADGEDFELLMTVNPTVFKRLKPAWQKKFPRIPLTAIGEIIKKSGIFYHQNNKPLRYFKSLRGYNHF